MLLIIEPLGDYRCIPKVSKQLRDLLEYNNRLRLVISFCMNGIFLMRCLLDFRDLIEFKRSCMP